MPEIAELPLAGYYRCGPTFVDTFLFLRFYPDGFWVYHDTIEPDFDFPAYLTSIDVDSIKRRFPRGHGLPDGKGGWRYVCGRYTRQTNVPVIGYGGLEVCRFADALVLTSWSVESDEFLWGEVEIVGPGRLRSVTYADGDCVFVPDQPAGSGTAIVA